MIICEECGCPVDPDSLQLHSDWHDKLLTKSDLVTDKLANPNRIRYVGDEIPLLDC
jgi:hypothetical protein